MFFCCFLILMFLDFGLLHIRRNNVLTCWVLGLSILWVLMLLVPGFFDEEVLVVLVHRLRCIHMFDYVEH